MTFSKKIIALLFFGLLSTEALWALKIFDIDGSRFLEHTKITFEAQKEKSAPRHARVVSFDVDKQEFKDIVYCMAPTERTGNPYKASFKNKNVGFDIQYHLDGGALKITLDPSINLAQDSWIVCAKASVAAWTDLAGMGLETIDVPDDGVRKGRVLIRKRGEQYKAQDLQTFLGQFQARRKKQGIDIFVTFRFDEEQLSREVGFLGEKGCANDPHYNDETRFLGELSADLTMMAFGLIKLPTKLNAQDHGFDGVYIPRALHATRNGPLTQIWLTEAKCFCNYGKMTIDAILNIIKFKLRSDKTLGITQRHKDVKSLQATAGLIYKFIDGAHGAITLLAQRVLGDGGIHSKCESLNREAYWATEEHEVDLVVRRKRPQTLAGATSSLSQVFTPVKEQMSETDRVTLMQEAMKMLGLEGKFTLTPKEQ